MDTVEVEECNGRSHAHSRAKIGPMFDGMHNGWLWGMPAFGFILWILLIGGVLWAIAHFQRGSTSPPPPSEPNESPLEILQRRYAQGELSTEEYEERKDRLERDV